MKRARIPTPSLGVDLRTYDTSMRSGAVRSAVNVDIKSGGGFSRRRGYTLATPATRLLAINASEVGVLVHREDELLVVDQATDELTHLCPFAGSDPADFTRYNDYLYVTNGTDFIKVLVPTGEVSPVGVPLPAHLPTLTEGPGALNPGGYGVVMTVLDHTGEESAAVSLGTIQLPGGGGIIAAGMPQDGRTYRFYVTHADGDLAYLLLEAPALFPDVLLSAQPEGAPAPELGMMPMPPGVFVCGHAGRLYTAMRNRVFFSEAFNPHLSKAGSNFMTFDGDIRMLKSVPTGLFVGDSRGVWFLEGQDPNQFTPRLASTEVAGMGSAQMVPRSAMEADAREGDYALPVWMTAVGYVVGHTSGLCKSIISDRISTDSGVDGRSAVLESRGTKQLITLTATPWGAIESAINSFKPAF